MQNQEKALVKELRRENNAANRTIKLLRGGGTMVTGVRTRDQAVKLRNDANRAGVHKKREHTAAGLRSHTTYDDYIRVVLDPEGTPVDPDLQVPGLIQYPTRAWKNEWELDVVADANGEVIALLRPGLGAVYAATGHVVATGMAHNYLSSTNGGAVYLDYPIPGNATATRQVAGVLINTWTVNDWDSMPEAQATIESFVAYQPIAACISAEYSSARLSATGRIIAFSIPGEQTIPSGNPNTRSMSYGNAQPLSYAGLVTLLDAKSTSVLNGARAIFVPEGSAAQRMRPTKPSPPYAAAQSDSQILGTANGPPCDGDPSEFSGAMQSMISSASLLNYGFDQAGAARSAASQALLALGMQRMLAQTISPDCPTLGIFCDGLIPGAIVTIKFTQVLCGIADSRTWSLSRAVSLNKQVPTSREEQTTAMILHSIPRVMPSTSNRGVIKATVAHAQKAHGILSKVWDGVKNYGPMISRAGSKMFEAIGMPEEAAFMGELASAGTLADLAGLLAF